MTGERSGAGGEAGPLYRVAALDFRRLAHISAEA
jgi:hypothetical protein